jgi:hypothetical protein
MLRATKHLEAHADRPFAAAQGDTVRQLRLMRIGADKSAVGAINRPLQTVYASIGKPSICMILSAFVVGHGPGRKM